MRGTQPVTTGIAIIGRITPAHAGNTATLGRLIRSCPDHPRTCGEHADVVEALSMYEGSPPHMRGTPRLTISCIWLWRITPAHAGNTLMNNGVNRLSSDHPRTCGEHKTTH